MERRAAFAVGISLLILYLYQAFVIRPLQPPADASKPATSTAPAATATSPTLPGPEAVVAPAPAAVLSETTERTITVDTGKVEAVISNRGGRTNLWRVAIDERSGQVLSQPELVPAPSSYTLQPNISRDGKLLVYENYMSSENIQRIAFDPNATQVVLNALDSVHASPVECSSVPVSP